MCTPLLLMKIFCLPKAERIFYQQNFCSFTMVYLKQFFFYRSDWPFRWVHRMKIKTKTMKMDEDELLPFGIWTFRWRQKLFVSLLCELRAAPFWWCASLKIAPIIKWRDSHVLRMKMPCTSIKHMSVRISIQIVEMGEKDARAKLFGPAQNWFEFGYSSLMWFIMCVWDRNDWKK